jgi:hypothetical protein
LENTQKETLKMPNPDLSYTITFRAARYYAAAGESSQKVPFFYIVDDETRQPVAYAFNENMAKIICLALELVNARVTDDRAHERELGREIDKLKQ